MNCNQSKKFDIKKFDIRQCSKVYDLCHTFLHVELVRKHTAMRESHAFPAMRESHAKRVLFSHCRVFSDSLNLQKRATKSDTLGSLPYFKALPYFK